jgi:hypothetical protein
LPALNIGDQALESWALNIPAREATIVVAVGIEHPAFMTLRRDIGFRCLALRVEAS